VPVLLLLGPSAAGKDSVARALASRRERAVVIDTDVVRYRFVQRNLTLWDGIVGDGPDVEMHSDAEAQADAGTRAASALARSFVEDGYGVILTDVRPDAHIARYRELLTDVDLRVVQLLPSFEATEERAHVRAADEGEYRVDARERRWLYDHQLAVTEYDERIDNTSLTPEETADRIEGWL
jgi:chloramphenicol 3-O-phosphotransferase